MSQFIEMFGNPLSPDQKYPIRNLGDCCELNPRRPFIDILDFDPVSFVPMPSVNEDGFMQNLTDKEYRKVKKGFTYFENNDVLFAKITPCMENGKGAIAHSLTNGIGMGSTEFHVLRPIANISNPYWLLCLTRMPIFRERAAKNMSGTGGQKRVGAEYISNFKIGLPPIAMQIKFAELYQQADKSKFIGFKSQFIEMFGNEQKVSLESLSAEWLKGQPFKKDEIIDDGTNQCIHYGELFTKYGAIINVVSSRTNAVIAKSSCVGDILFPASDVTPNGLTRCSSVMFDNVLLGGDIIIMRPQKGINPQYLSYAINAQKEQLLSRVTGSIVKHLSGKSLKSVTVPIPSLDMQDKYVAIAKQADKSKYIN